MRSPWGEAAVRATREPGNLAKRLFTDRIVSLLKHESGNVAQAKFAGRDAQIVELLLHGITNEDKSRDLCGVVLTARVRQDLCDLRVTAAAIDPRHQCTEPPRLCNPRRRATFGQAAI